MVNLWLTTTLMLLLLNKALTLCQALYFQCHSQDNPAVSVTVHHFVNEDTRVKASDMTYPGLSVLYRPHA